MRGDVTVRAEGGQVVVTIDRGPAVAPVTIRTDPATAESTAANLRSAARQARQS